MSFKEPPPVNATDEEVREAYEEISKIYKVLEESFGKKVRERGLELLNPRSGEEILEVGFGTGCALVDIARLVGKEGKVYGVDISEKMVKLAEERVEKEGLSDRVELSKGDARELSYEDNKFDRVYMAETLELFSAPDITKVLDEIKRVLKNVGCLGIVSMNREGNENSKFVRVYEWLHQKFPRYLNCRPIYVADVLRNSGYEIEEEEDVMSGWLCPMKIVVAKQEKET
ncbi:hypothetical protein AKJ45_03510 [candidate division MSBL1 archaeon SCGC-AAA261F19]|uniref:Methyltransferase domain-containing protein n=1 Tax=candidate division MSBL1 archaeon SCGC-AAA261F19 TaxID=1698275 RepID=A0A133V7L2_9EURY|nr:hypothetical protein AKJ45_03510 [candidate division MSBL1 archaeon SCGC-AAA261F19]